MKRYAIGLMMISLCLGQNCLNSVDTGAGTGTGGDSSGGDTGGTPPTVKGIPEGFYSGTMTVQESLDNLSDAYPAQKSNYSVTVSERFDSNGRLLQPDGTPLAVGDVLYTKGGEVAETVASVTVGTSYFEYRTTVEGFMNGPAEGLSWQFAGNGLHTYRYSGSKVLYDGTVDMTSDVSGGVSYRWISESSATLAP